MPSGPETFTEMKIGQIYSGLKLQWKIIISEKMFNFVDVLVTLSVTASFLVSEYEMHICKENLRKSNILG